MVPTTEHPVETNAEEVPEFSRGFLVFLLVMTIFALVHAMDFRSGYRLWADVLRLDPVISFVVWIQAGGITIANGLAEFQGKTPELVSDAAMRSGLLSVLLAFIVAPTLCLMGIRVWSRLRADRGGRFQWRASHLIYLIASALVLTIMLVGVAGAVFGKIVSTSLRHAQAIQRSKDYMINDINAIRYQARQYRILPTHLGGGQGTFTGFTLSKELSQTEHAAYSITVSDSSVIVRGTSVLFVPSSITVTIDARGQLSSWNYTDQFRL